MSSKNSSYLVPDLQPNVYHEHEIIIKRSRFITTIAHTASVDEAKAFIETISLKYKDATHNCFAYNATEPGSTAFCGCSDDGEPKGTAGQPMLNVILHCNIGEITAVVTRYFGGILLGTGGLVKAYQGSVKEALQNLPSCEHMIARYITIAFDHKFVPSFKHILPKYRASIEKEFFEQLAYFQIKLPFDLCEEFKQVLIGLTKGQLTILEETDILTD